MIGNIPMAKEDPLGSQYLHPPFVGPDLCIMPEKMKQAAVRPTQRSVAGRGMAKLRAALLAAIHMRAAGTSKPPFVPGGLELIRYM